MSQIHSCGRRVFHHTIAFRGFSLVELLVVVAILVTLGGLVLATMRGHASDRVGTSSRLLQSSLQGLRVKASARRTTTGMGFVPGGEGVTNRAFPIVRSVTLVLSEEVDKVNFFLEFRRRDVVPPIGDYE
ncbi:MAG: Tfp pilus assembly protein FimT/FimU, partial [Planctomycetaceae bacterium]